MIEYPMLSYKHRPEPFSNGVYEIDSKRGEIGNQKFPIILPRIWREFFTSVAYFNRYSQLSHGYKRQKW